LSQFDVAGYGAACHGGTKYAQKKDHSEVKSIQFLTPLLSIAVIISLDFENVAVDDYFGTERGDSNGRFGELWGIHHLTAN
jgi:hypothetical protein